MDFGLLPRTRSRLTSVNPAIAASVAMHQTAENGNFSSQEATR
jgi:hypothetical protein